MKDIIFQLVSSIVQTIILYICMLITSTKFSNENIEKPKKIIAFSILLITILTLNLFSNIIMKIPFFNTLIFICVMFIISIVLFKVKKIKALLNSIFPILVMFVSELSSVFICMSIFKTNSLELQSTLLLKYTVIGVECAIAFIILFIIMKLINKGTNKVNLKDIFSSNNLSVKIIVILALCTVPQFILFYIYKFNYPVSILIVNSLQLIIVCVILFNYLKTNMEKEKAESDLEISELHNKTMIGMVDGVRTLKHDYNNIMQALNGYVSTKQYDKLQEHINKVLDECNIVNNLSVIDQKVFNDPAIYGIVGAKYFIAMEADIKFELDIVTNIKEISFPMPELSRILGIVLDNAIEATSKTDNKYMKLEMKYDARKDADIIKVYNTYDTNIDINLKDIYKKGVSSKKVKSGIGLWEVKKLIDKSKNSQIYASLEHDMFVQNIIIEKVIN